MSAGVLLWRPYSSRHFNHGEIGMKSRLVGCFVAGALSAALALASPELARGGMGGGGGGGMHGGMGGGGGMRGSMGGGMGGGGMHFGGMGGGMHVGGMGPAAHFSGAHFASRGFAGPGLAHSGFAHSSFAHPGFAPRSSRFAFHDGRFFHHRHHRFFFVGAPYAYAAYDSCWRRVWTPYGLQWANVCGDYRYY
jgi:hypothetical protein